jgi:hypothetical protein
MVAEMFARVPFIEETPNHEAIEEELQVLLQVSLTVPGVEGTASLNYCESRRDSYTGGCCSNTQLL